jgi:hypothetical protein
MDPIAPSTSARRAGQALALALLLWAAAGAVPAAADPVANSHKETFPVACAGQTYLVVAGPGVAAQVVEATDLLVATAFVQVTSWVDPATGETVTVVDAFTIGNGKRAGQQDRLVDCAYQATFTDPELGPVAVDGTVTVRLAPGG